MDIGPFSGWGLQPVRLTDQAVFLSAFRSLREPLSDYTFSQLFAWGNALEIYWKQIRGHLCVFANGTGDLTLLMPPIGEGNSDRALEEAFEIMDAYNHAQGVAQRSRVEYVSQELLARFDPGRFSAEPCGGDYVYDVRAMIDLAGGELASKRQARNRFLRLYRHRVEEYDPGRHLQPCLQLLEQWKQRQDVHHAMEPSVNAVKRLRETLACERSLHYSRALGLEGMVVLVQDEGGESVRGFTFGETLTSTQSSITIEKTDLACKGLAQFIFAEFCRTRWSHLPLVNVGDDWGLPTLAWTKKSYRPVKMLSKFILRRKAPVAVAAANSAPIVRRAGKGDLAAAVELERTCFTAYNLTKRQLQYLQQRPTAVFLVAEEGGKVVGEGIGLVRRGKKGLSGRIYSLAVDPAARGRRIGQQLLDSMIRQLQSRGVKRIYLEVEQTNQRAVNLYQQAGFVPAGVLPDYYGPSRDALRMKYEPALSEARKVMV